MFPLPALEAGQHFFTAQGINSRGKSGMTPTAELVLLEPAPGVPGGISFTVRVTPRS